MLDASKELFQSFTGKYLSVSEGFDRGLRNRFPEVDLQREYLNMDAYLEANPSRRPKTNWPRFVTNWLIKHERNRVKVAAEVKVGSAPKAEDHGVKIKDSVLKRYIVNQGRI